MGAAWGRGPAPRRPGLPAAGPGSSCSGPLLAMLAFVGAACLALGRLQPRGPWSHHLHGARCHRRSARRGTGSELEMGSHRLPRYSRPSETWRTLPLASYPIQDSRPTLRSGLRLPRRERSEPQSDSQNSQALVVSPLGGPAAAGALLGEWF